MSDYQGPYKPTPQGGGYGMYAAKKPMGSYSADMLAALRDAMRIKAEAEHRGYGNENLFDDHLSRTEDDVKRMMKARANPRNADLDVHEYPSGDEILSTMESGYGQGAIEGDESDQKRRLLELLKMRRGE